MINLPLDIWDVIIASTSHDDQRVLLHVDRTQHAVACRRLFNTLHLYLGAWETSHVALNDKGYERNQDGRALTRSLAIFDHVPMSLPFAQSVHTVVVHAYMKGVQIPDPSWREFCGPVTCYSLIKSRF
jgi:hypothetical protein